MIEKMIIQVREFLPLKISEVDWDGTSFNMYSVNWSFASLSAWRISKKNVMCFGCYDKDSESLKALLKNVEIVNIEIQDALLKIDPIFILSNDLVLEFFSTDTYEPWTFRVDGLGFYGATPSMPSLFDSNA